MSGRKAFPLLLFFYAFCVGTESARCGEGGPVTFWKGIAPIFQRNCQSCNHPGTIAPMALLTYEEARPYAKSIRKSVAERSMPPWHADPKIGKFKNDRRLSDGDLKKI